MSLDPRIHAYRADLAHAQLEGQVKAARFAIPRPMRVRVPVAPLFTSPSQERIGSQLLFGTGFDALEVDRARGLVWGQSQLDGYVGYVPLDALDHGVPGTQRIEVPFAPLFPAPDIKAATTLALPYLAQITPLAEEGAFVRCAEGYLHRTHLTAEQGTDAVTRAARYLGAPYLWGGLSWRGLDCSALVQLAHLGGGIACPRDADQQQAAATLVARADLQRGDLVFWPGHVGILRDAKTLLHANGHHMQVVQEPLAEAEARIEAQDGTPVAGFGRF